MLHVLKHAGSKREERVIRECLRDRRPFPGWITEAPELEQQYVFFWDAFYELNTCRSAGLAMGPIPWTAVHEYAKAQELDADSEEDFLHVVRAMDNAFVEFHSPPASKKAETKWRKKTPRKSLRAG